jgi:hypothetical protein
LFNDAAGVRVAIRDYGSPTIKFNNAGFRICRTVP